MAEVKKIGRVTFRKLTDEEARTKYGSLFVFVVRPVSTRRAEEAARKNAVAPPPKTAHQPIGRSSDVFVAKLRQRVVSTM